MKDLQGALMGSPKAFFWQTIGLLALRALKELNMAALQ